MSKVWFITGASSGFGAELAKAAIERGDQVVATFRKPAQASDFTMAHQGKGLGVLLDVTQPAQIESSVQRALQQFGRIDVLVNNAGEQHPDKDITDISEEQLRRTFQTNIFGMFFLVQAARPHLGRGAAIINCTSITGYKGSSDLLDYSATKGAITAFTRSLALNLVKDGIRVNAVAPGPIWTPLNLSGGTPPEELPDFGKDTPMGRPGQPNEVAPAFLFLACADSSYMTGQVLHPNGGQIVNG